MGIGVKRCGLYPKLIKKAPLYAVRSRANGLFRFSLICFLMPDERKFEICDEGKSDSG